MGLRKNDVTHFVKRSVNILKFGIEIDEFWQTRPCNDFVVLRCVRNSLTIIIIIKDRHYSFFSVTICTRYCTLALI